MACSSSTTRMRAGSGMPRSIERGGAAYTARMNYRHAFHAGNHADVLKHVVLLALCDALTAKPAACFALDTHAGRGLYGLGDYAARQTGEADSGIGRLRAAAVDEPLLRRYLEVDGAWRDHLLVALTVVTTLHASSEARTSRGRAHLANHHHHLHLQGYNPAVTDRHE